MLIYEQTGIHLLITYVIKMHSDHSQWKKRKDIRWSLCNVRLSLQNNFLMGKLEHVCIIDHIVFMGTMLFSIKRIKCGCIHHILTLQLRWYLNNAPSNKICLVYWDISTHEGHNYICIAIQYRRICPYLILLKVCFPCTICWNFFILGII